MEGDFFRERLIHITIENTHIINIYFPANKYKKFEFIEQLDKYLSEYSMDNLIIGGFISGWGTRLIEKVS